MCAKPQIPLFLPALLFFVSCVPPKVRYDYDHQANFANYKSFAYLGTPKSAQLRAHDMTQRHVQSAVVNELKARGFTQAEANTPSDFKVYFYPVVQAEVSYITDYTWHTAYTQQHVRPVGSFVLDIVDTKSNQVIWTGSAQGAITSQDTPEEVQEAVKSTVTRILAKFPPPPPSR